MHYTEHVVNMQKALSKQPHTLIPDAVRKRRPYLKSKAYIIRQVLFKFQTEVCEMGRNFWLQNGLNLLCRLWPCGPRPKQTHVWSQLEASYDFQNLWLLLRKCEFFKFRKHSVSLAVSSF